MSSRLLKSGTSSFPTTNLRCKRVEEGPNYTRYACTWELRLGFRRGAYTMTETVPHHYWMKQPSDGGANAARAAAAAARDKDAEADDDDASHDNSDDGGDEDGPSGSGALWQKKYRELLAVVEKKDRQMADFKKHLLDTLKEDPRTG